MKTIILLPLLFLASLSLASPPGVEILSCSNLHRISDPNFQQGDEVFLKLSWTQKSNSLHLTVNQLSESLQYSPEGFQLTKPELSWLSMTGTSKTGKTLLFRFTYLGGQTWGGYFDGVQQKGTELLCQESRNFQDFIDANR